MATANTFTLGPEVLGYTSDQGTFCELHASFSARVCSQIDRAERLAVDTGQGGQRGIDMTFGLSIAAI